MKPDMSSAGTLSDPSPRRSQRFGRDIVCKSHLALRTAGGHRCAMDESVIERDEVTALLFAVHDINATLLRIEDLLVEDDGEAEEDD